MISYREKELLMVMRMIQDETKNNAQNIENVLNNINNNEEISSIREMEKSSQKYDNYDDLVSLAKERGYDLYIRAEDVLSPEEIKDLLARKEGIEKEFKEKVKLKGKDYLFLFSAVALQLAKQVFLTIDLEDRKETADKTEKEYKEKYDNEKEIDGQEKAKRYYAPKQQIANTKTVPYDIVKNTKYFGNGDKETGLGLNGDNHRFKSVGHDPLLGLVVGTANILTNTATFYTDKHIMQSFHIGYEDMYYYRKPFIKSYASTGLMMIKVCERYKDEPEAIKAAFVKEIDHIQSDKKSIAGIPLPFLTMIFGDEEAKKLVMKGFDLNTFDKVVDVGKQAGATIIINLVISWLHKLYILWDEIKETEGTLEKAKKYLKTEINDLDKIRTKKIVMYSNLIATTVNLGVCVGGGIACSTSNPELSKKLLSHTDIGGLMVTIVSLFKDTKFILKVKDDFIKATINKEFEERLSTI